MTLTAEDRAALYHIIDDAWRGEQRFFIRRDGTDYVPGKGQLQFHDSPAKMRAIFGGRGSGKSTAGAQEAVRKISQGESGIVANPDFENLKLSTWPEFKAWIPWHHVLKHDQRMAVATWVPSKPFEIHFDNGATVYVKGIKDPDSARGPNVNWLWYDEGGRDQTGEGFKVALGGVRIGNNTKTWVTTTPKGVRHWLYKYFVTGYLPEEAQQALKDLGFTGKLYDHAFATIHENKHNLDPIFYAQMLSMYEGKFAQQELEGKFVEIAEGVVFDEFSPENITTQEPNPSHPIELAYDDGYVDPRVVLFIQKFPTHVLVFDEYRRTRELAEKSVSNVVDRINSWPWPLDEKQRAKLDHQVAKMAKAKDDPKGKLVHYPVEFAVGSPEAKELQRHWRNADIKARQKQSRLLDRIKLVRRYIKDANDVRALLVNPRCEGFINELTSDYRYPDNARRDTEKPEDGNDHACEAFGIWARLRLK